MITKDERLTRAAKNITKKYITIEQNIQCRIEKNIKYDIKNIFTKVELSVGEGASGVHVLVVFSEVWIENGQDRISPLLTTMFPGKISTEYQTENGRSEKNLIQAVAELDKCGREYFLIFAHVEDNKGLWKEMCNAPRLSRVALRRVIKKLEFNFLRVAEWPFFLDYAAVAALNHLSYSYGVI